MTERGQNLLQKLIAKIQNNSFEFINKDDHMYEDNKINFKDVKIKALMSQQEKVDINDESKQLNYDEEDKEIDSNNWNDSNSKPNSIEHDASLDDNSVNEGQDELIEDK